MRYPLQIVQAASHLWILAQGRRAINAALLLCFAGLIVGCGFSSNSISIVGPAPPTLTSISVTPADLTLHVGSTRQFIATGTYSDGSQQNITASVTWSSTAATVASINNTAGSNGIATAVAAGSTTITAASGTLSGSTTLNVTSVTLVSIGVTPAAPTIAQGTTQQFTATGVYSDNTTQNLTPVVSWHVVNPAVASITTALGSGGLATGVAPGTTQITASLGGVIGSTNLTVTAAATLVSIDVTPATATIRIGATQQYTATGHYTDLTTQDITASVTWNSATMATATISNAAGSNGLATGLAQGTTLITAALGAINSNAPAATLTVTAFAYAVNINKTNAPNASNLSQYIIGTNGTLSPMNTPTVATGNNPYSLTTDPSNHFVYVANYDTSNVTTGSVSQFAIGADGSLTPLSTPSVAAGGGPNGIAANPTAPYVYVANYNSSNVSQYQIGVGGLLAALGTPTVGTGPGASGAASIALTPAGTYAYVANNNYSGTVGSVSQYNVGAAGSAAPGSLTLMTNPTVPAGAWPNDVVVDPSGRFVYVVNSHDNANGDSISQYTIQSDGSLMPMTPPTVTTLPGLEPWSITLDATGRNAYVPNRNNGNVGTVSHYTIDASGALTLANSVAAGTGATSLAIDPSGKFAYVTNRDPLTTAPHTISQYSIAANGDLTLLAPPTATAGAQPAAIITSR